MTDNCIFCEIVRGETNTELLHEDDEVVAFHDVNPVTGMHLLVIPKKHVPALDALSAEHGSLVSNLMLTAQKLGNQHSPEHGYRIAVNGGGQEDVPHLHLHVMGGQADLGEPAKGVTD